MGSEKSEQMLALLKEFAVLKQIDSDPGANQGAVGSERTERRLRRTEIRKQIKELAKDKNPERS
jgi:hypothetical protein